MAKPKKKSYWTTKTRAPRSKGGDTNIMETQARVSAMFAEARAEVEAQHQEQAAQAVLAKEQGQQETPSGQDLPSFDFDDISPDPLSDGASYLDRLEAGLSPWWQDSKF